MAVSKLYVGNLTYSVTKEELQEMFSAYGEIKSVTVLEGKGFGFVEMSTPEEAAKAKEGLDGKDLAGRKMKVDEAKPPKDKGSYGNRGGSGGGRGGFGGGRDRY